jgi:hypothetical protein
MFDDAKPYSPHAVFAEVVLRALAGAGLGHKMVALVERGAPRDWPRVQSLKGSVTSRNGKRWVSTRNVNALP